MSKVSKEIGLGFFDREETGKDRYSITNKELECARTKDCNFEPQPENSNNTNDTSRLRYLFEQLLFAINHMEKDVNCTVELSNNNLIKLFDCSKTGSKAASKTTILITDSVKGLKNKTAKYILIELHADKNNMDDLTKLENATQEILKDSRFCFQDENIFLLTKPEKINSGTKSVKKPSKLYAEFTLEQLKNGDAANTITSINPLKIAIAKRQFPRLNIKAVNEVQSADTMHLFDTLIADYLPLINRLKPENFIWHQNETLPTLLPGPNYNPQLAAYKKRLINEQSPPPEYYLVMSDKNAKVFKREAPDAYDGGYDYADFESDNYIEW